MSVHEECELNEGGTSGTTGFILLAVEPFGHYFSKIQTRLTLSRIFGGANLDASASLNDLEFEARLPQRE